MNIFDNIAANLSLKYENSEFYKNKLINHIRLIAINVAHNAEFKKSLAHNSLVGQFKVKVLFKRNDKLVL